MKPLLVLAPIVAGALGYLGGRALSPAAAASVRVPVPAGDRQTAPPPPCPTAPAPAGAGVDLPTIPAGWDPVRAERDLWERRATELAAEGGLLVTVDCARYPCIAVMAWGPEASQDLEARYDGILARWPGAEAGSSTSMLDGHLVAWHQVVLYESEVHPDVAREVALRQLAVNAEASEPVWSWLRAEVAALAP